MFFIADTQIGCVGRGCVPRYQKKVSTLQEFRSQMLW